MMHARKDEESGPIKIHFVTPNGATMRAVVHRRSSVLTTAAAAHSTAPKTQGRKQNKKN
jgi:hypothetical protein